MPKLTRISYNSQNWQRPTGDARRHEAPGTYNHEHGFGHEDWLFRSEWLIDGWRYAFLQGVNKSHRRLVAAKQAVDLTLFTVEPDKRRRYVATVGSVECLDDQQAQDAVNAFSQRGWLQSMQAEIEAIDGNTHALGNAQWAKHILNVRFRLEDVVRFESGAYAKSDDPVMRLNRYMLYDIDNIEEKLTLEQGVLRLGTTAAPIAGTFLRRATAAVECSPEHAKMQARLLAELRVEFPCADIVCEENFIDITMRTDTETVLFEIKSDINPRTVLRQALGQLLEYAYHPARDSGSLPLRLVVAGRSPLAISDNQYLDRLRADFLLPLEYRVVAI